jgi:transcription-repair coupling factor (superfamily II helicase)
MAAFGKIGLKPESGAHSVIDGVADGYEAFVIAKIAEEAAGKGPLIYVLRDGQRMADVEQVLGFIAPGLPVLQFPAWDCLPYDRVSPSTDVSARRLSALASLIGLQKSPHPAIILTTANALIQRVPPADFIARQTVIAEAGGRADMNELTRRLGLNGFERVGTVRDVGEYAVRGGILDIFAPGADEPLRLDFFGDTLESIRAFDPGHTAHNGPEKKF